MASKHEKKMIKMKIMMYFIIINDISERESWFIFIFICVNGNQRGNYLVEMFILIVSQKLCFIQIKTSFNCDSDWHYKVRS